jgi:putative ABC transport system permease protein
LTTLALRNVLRNKVRLCLCVLGVAVALTAFVVLRTAVDSWGAAAEGAHRDRLVTRQKMTFIMPLPRRYVADLAAARGADGEPLVNRVTYATWYGGKDPARPHAFFASHAIDPMTYFQVYDEARVAPAELLAFQQDRNGAVVGDLLAKQMGWSVGDHVRLVSDIYPSPEGAPMDLTIRAIYTSQGAADRNVLMLHWARLDDTLPAGMQGNVGWMVSRASSPARAAAVAPAIDAMFEQRETETLTQDERTFTLGFAGMASAVLDVIAVLSLAVLGIQALVLANAIGMGVRERAREYASLAAMGFTRGRVALVVLMESAMVAAVGAAVGSLFGFVIVNHGLSGFFEQNMASFFPVFRLTARTLITAVALALGLGLASGALPAWLTIRPRVADAVRRAR